MTRLLWIVLAFVSCAGSGIQSRAERRRVDLTGPEGSDVALAAASPPMDHPPESHRLAAPQGNDRGSVSPDSTADSKDRDKTVSGVALRTVAVIAALAIVHYATRGAGQDESAANQDSKE